MLKCDSMEDAAGVRYTYIAFQSALKKVQQAAHPAIQHCHNGQAPPASARSRSAAAAMPQLARPAAGSPAMLLLQGAAKRAVPLQHSSAASFK